MRTIHDQILGANSRPLTFDLSLCDKPGSPLVIFLHGFKGFKDWGHWPLLPSYFVQQNISFLKFNFSHNGVTPNQPQDFADLEAFSENTFSKEVMDFRSVLDWIKSYEVENGSFSKKIVIGHSRGGAISLIGANLFSEIDAVITYNGVATLERFKPNELAYWKENGVIYLPNARTHQQMPLKYSLVTDFYENQDIYTLENIAANFDKPYLIIQGDQDETVFPDEGKQLHSWYKTSRLEIVKGANHVLNGGHPYEKMVLPEATLFAVQASFKFIHQL